MKIYKRLILVILCLGVFHAPEEPGQTMTMMIKLQEQITKTESHVKKHLKEINTIEFILSQQQDEFVSLPDAEILKLKFNLEGNKQFLEIREAELKILKQNLDLNLKLIAKDSLPFHLGISTPYPKDMRCMLLERNSFIPEWPPAYAEHSGNLLRVRKQENRELLFSLNVGSEIGLRESIKHFEKCAIRAPNYRDLQVKFITLSYHQYCVHEHEGNCQINEDELSSRHLSHDKQYEELLMQFKTSECYNSAYNILFDHDKNSLILDPIDLSPEPNQNLRNLIYKPGKTAEFLSVDAFDLYPDSCLICRDESEEELFQIELGCIYSFERSLQVLEAAGCPVLSITIQPREGEGELFHSQVSGNSLEIIKNFKKYCAGKDYEWSVDFSENGDLKVVSD